jgi:hypothetical protein
VTVVGGHGQDGDALRPHALRAADIDDARRIALRVGKEREENALGHRDERDRQKGSEEHLARLRTAFVRAGRTFHLQRASV